MGEYDALQVIIQLVHGRRGHGCSGKYSMGQREVCLGFQVIIQLVHGCRESGCSGKYSTG